MVLGPAKGNPGLRFLLGIVVISLSIYLFYIGLARKNSPQLFIVPAPVKTVDYPCKVERSDTLSACIPSTMRAAPTQKGLVFHSLELRTRGEIFILEGGLPEEKAWRDSLKTPIVRVFLGDTEDSGTFHLMKDLLRHRWNPSLMGIKARLMPSWTKGRSDVEILIPEALPALIFYTPERALGLAFGTDHVAVLTVSGHFDKTLLAGMLRSISPQ